MRMNRDPGTGAVNRFWWTKPRVRTACWLWQSMARISHSSNLVQRVSRTLWAPATSQR